MPKRNVASRVLPYSQNFQIDYSKHNELPLGGKESSKVTDGRILFDRKHQMRKLYKLKSKRTKNSPLHFI